MTTKGLEFLETKLCPVCRKYFSVLYPHLWRYKVQITSNRYKYFCSWKCLRADEQRRSNEPMRKLTTEQRQHAIEIAMKGTNPISYLELTCGISNGPQCWSNIKKHLKERDPETWEKVKDVPRHSGGRKAKEAEPATVKLSGPIKIVTDEPENVEIAEDEPKTAGEAMAACEATAKKFFDFCDEVTGRKGLNINPESMAKFPKPLDYGGFTVTAVRKEFGQYFCNECCGTVYLDFETNDGEEISLPVEAWKNLLKEIMDAAAILGVDLNETDPS